MQTILSIPLSNHQSLKESAHVISPSCNLLGLQLKACVNVACILALLLEPPAIRSPYSSRNNVMTGAIIKCPPPCITPT